jgi:hypothetical protein
MGQDSAKDGSRWQRAAAEVPAARGEKFGVNFVRSVGGASSCSHG